MGIEETLKHQRAFLNKIKARKELETFVLGGVEIEVNPGVFSPATDTKLLAANVDTGKGMRFLDMSTGSGGVAVIAGLTGASGIAIDINPKAVINARRNVKRYKVLVNVVESDMYTKIPSEKFDRIYANGPFAEGEITEVLDRACYGARDYTQRLFFGMKNYLKTDGKALVVFPEWAEIDFFEKCIRDNDLSFRISAKRSSDDGQRIYRLYEVKTK